MINFNSLDIMIETKLLQYLLEQKLGKFKFEPHVDENKAKTLRVKNNR